uniref:Uncharacterized protein n=1 Tax=Aegilops tauschii subsp. strangulata TaxID=200361 RepID=A0A453ND61_AEGTS
MRCQGLTALDSGLVGRRRWRLLVVGGGLYASRVGFRAVLEEGRWHRGRGVWGWRGLRRGRSVRRRRWRGLRLRRGRRGRGRRGFRLRRGRSVRGRRWRGRCRWAGARAGARARRRRTPLPVGRGERRRGGVVPAAVRLLGLQGQAQEEQGHQESGFATRHSLTPSRTAMFLARSVWL